MLQTTEGQKGQHRDVLWEMLPWVVVLFMQSLGDWRTGVHGKSQHTRRESIPVLEGLAQKDRRTGWI